MLDIVIVGAGGFAREVFTQLEDCLSDCEFRVKGFLARESGELKKYTDIPVLANPEDYQPGDGDRFVLAIGDISARRRTTEALVGRGGRFLSLIHPTAYVAKTARIGDGAVIYPYATISNAAVLEDFVHLSLYASVGHDSLAGQFSLLSPYATLNGFANIDDDVFMGTHSMLGPGCEIGRQSKVCANTAVLHNVPARSFVYGVPGRHTRRLDVGDD